MAVYKNLNTASPLTSVEFAPVADGNFTFFNLDKPESKDAVRQWLTSPDMGQEIVAETLVNGKPVLVTHGDKTKEEMMKVMEAQGEKLQLHQKDHKFNPWFWRGAMSMIGQPMQLASSILQKGGLDGSTATFAISNIAANLVNMFFGAEKAEDKNRLRFLKTKINEDLDEHMSFSEEPYDIDDNRAALRQGPGHPKSMGAKIHDFIRANSVRGGEIGLRYFGSLAMVFPLGKYMSNWKKIGHDFFREGPIQALKAGSNLRKDKWNFWVGVAYLTGKSIGFFSKVPDPYDPKPHSTLDTIREKYLFRLSTAIETVGASAIVYDRFTNRKITIPNKKLIPPSLRKNTYRDFLGGIGGAMFVGGFLIRFTAPFGERAVNMDELLAHAEDTLAKTPPEKLPQLMADTTAMLKEHFKNKDVAFSEIFTKMMTDMYRYHHIALDNLGTEPEERLAKLAETAPEPATPTKYTPAQGPRNAMDRVTLPAASHTDGIAKSDESSLALGA